MILARVVTLNAGYNAKQEEVMKFKPNQKIRCIDDSKQKVLKVGEIYTVDTTLSTTDNRVYIKEWKRFSFSVSRFELVE